MKKQVVWDMSQEYFMMVDDHQSKTRGQLKIVNPDCYLDFIEFVLKLRIKPQIKLIALLQLTTGSRITEILNLKTKDINWRENNAKIRVLKKDRTKRHWILFMFPPILWPLLYFLLPNMLKNGRDVPKYRYGAIHPDVMPTLKAWAEGLGPEERLFKITRFGVLKAYKKYWGILTHSLRHSMITYMIEVQQKNWDWIMNHFYFTEVKTALRYFKQSTAKEAAKIFTKKSA